MGTLSSGAVGSQPSVSWVITWSGDSEVFNVTVTKNADGYFSGGGWTCYLGFESGPSWNFYIAAPTGATGSAVSQSYNVDLSSYGTVPGSGTIYFYTTSTNFTSSGVIPYASRISTSYAKVYTVTVMDYVGSSAGTFLGSGTYQCAYGTYTNARTLRVATYTGYTYSSNNGNAYIYGPSTLYNWYTANSYNIYYYGNDSNGTIANMPSSGTISYNTAISSLTPTNTYTVTLNANGGTCSTASLASTRTFGSWNTASNGTGTAWSPGATFAQTSALSLYAQWGSASSVALPTPTRTGYEFVGWGTTSSATTGITGNYTPTGTVTLYAVWKANGVVHLYQGSDGRFHSYLVWIYIGDGAGPNSNGWHHAMPKLYCTSGGSTKFHTCG